MRARLELVMMLPSTLTFTATPPAPTLTASERMICDDSESTLNDDASVMVEPLIEATVVLAITFADSATPTPTPPAATPNANASILERFVELTVIAPPASITDPDEISAVVTPVMIFPVKETRTPTLPAATPPDNAVILESESAVTSRAVPLVTVDASIFAATVLATTLAPARIPTETPPEPATLIPRDRIVETSSAETTTLPPASMLELPSMSASTLLVMTLPKAVALTATPPLAATPMVRAIIPAFESVSITTSPLVEVTAEA